MGKAQKIKERQDKDGMLRRALERIIQLYTDKAHFVYELLQNAEDAQAENIKFIQYDDRLDVLHDGKPFTDDNLQSLYDIGLSDKVDDLTKIGEFGVGFKSVFSICKEVKFFSRPEHFRNQKLIDGATPFGLKIIDFVNPEDIDIDKLGANYTTKFVFPFAAGESFSGYDTIQELNNKLTEKLENLSETTLLFMKNLKSIEYEINRTTYKNSGCYMLDKIPLSDNCYKVQTLSENKNKKSNNDESANISYLIFSKKTDVFRAERSIDIAFAFKETKEGWTFIKAPTRYISVFFPTETESKLNFIVQGPYRTTPNRSSVPLNDDNKNLAIDTAQLLKESILAIRDMGKLNLSFLNILPMKKDDFYYNSYNSSYSFEPFVSNLFTPLFDATKTLLKSKDVIPCRSGGYTNATQAKLVRSKELAEIFSNEYITSLLKSDKSLHWLPEVITADSKEYRELYEYLTNELSIKVIAPDNLSFYLTDNPDWIKNRAIDIEWLTKFYSFLSKTPALFSQTRGAGQMLIVPFVKTHLGSFIAPFRKGEDNKYLPNVFIPLNDSPLDNSMAFVDVEIYNKCSDFFNNVLHLEKPKEYDYWIKGLQKRYSDGYNVSDEQHIADARKILHYYESSDYGSDIKVFLEEHLLLRCKKNGVANWYNPFKCECYLEKTSSGIDIKGYFENIKDVVFLDDAFYSENDIDLTRLLNLKIKNNLIIGVNRTEGEYNTKKGGRKPSWHTEGTFRWNLSIIDVDKALEYIWKNPNDKNSWIKSQTIFKLLQGNEDKLTGTVYINGNSNDIQNASSQIVQILLRNSWRDSQGSYYKTILKDWDCKWLYTASMELVSSIEISKHDLNTALYGTIRFDSNLYDILQFKKEEIDKAEDEVKEFSSLSDEQKESFGRLWLEKWYGITPDELNVLIKERSVENGNDESDDYEFPKYPVRDWESLKRTVEEKLSYASPVEYHKVLRQIRTTKNSAVSYLKHIYKVDGRTNQFACQLCHNSFLNIEKCQLDGRRQAEKELDSMHLCFCPNCAAKFKAFKETEDFAKFKDVLLNLTQEDIEDFNPVAIPTKCGELWFAQVHIAEISELLKLQNEAEKCIAAQEQQEREDELRRQKEKEERQHKLDEERRKIKTFSDLKCCIGKDVRYQTNGNNSTKADCVVKVLNVSSDMLTVLFKSGIWPKHNVGEEIKLGVQACLSSRLLSILP